MGIYISSSPSGKHICQAPPTNYPPTQKMRLPWRVFASMIIDNYEYLIVFQKEITVAIETEPEEVLFNNKQERQPPLLSRLVVN